MVVMASLLVRRTVSSDSVAARLLEANFLRGNPRPDSDWLQRAGDRRACPPEKRAGHDFKPGITLPHETR